MRGYEEKAKRFLLFSSVTLLITGLFVLFFKFLFLPTLPFLLALLISWPVTQLSVRIEKKTGISRRLWCFLLVLIICIALLALLWLCLSLVSKELLRLISGKGAILDKMSDAYEKLLSFTESRFPKIYQRLSESGFEERLVDFLSSKSEKISSFLAQTAFLLPGALLFTVVTFLSAYYFACDNRRIKDRIRAILPPLWGERLSTLFRTVKKSFCLYLRAGGYMMLLTFAVLLVGFLILKIGFPFLLALLTAAVDFLPVLGTGVILLPASLICFSSGNSFQGFGLLILWGAVLLLRQLLEPKIMGRSIGVHPLFSLFSCYVGFKLFGAAGLILFPIMLSAAAEVIRDYPKQRSSERNPPEGKAPDENAPGGKEADAKTIVGKNFVGKTSRGKRKE